MENNSSFSGKLFRGIRERLRKLPESPYREVNLNWLTTKYYKHLPAGKLRSHVLFGKKLYYYSPAELLHGIDEIFIDNLYKQELSDSPYIIDCGANIGLSIIYMKRLYPQATILAFEPDEQNFMLLSKNVESFGLNDVTLRKEAIWKENTLLDFSGDGAMYSKIADGPTSNSTKVKAVRLKDLLIREVDFLKIDIEGAEFSVLMDLNDETKWVKNMFIEYHGNFDQNHELSTLLMLLTEKGFNYYIKEATPVYKTPFLRTRKPNMPYDVQLNIFCFRTNG